MTRWGPPTLLLPTYPTHYPTNSPKAGKGKERKLDTSGKGRREDTSEERGMQGRKGEKGLADGMGRQVGNDVGAMAVGGKKRLYGVQGGRCRAWGGGL